MNSYRAAALIQEWVVTTDEYGAQCLEARWASQPASTAPILLAA
jgi:hypothetical protein